MRTNSRSFLLRSGYIIEITLRKVKKKSIYIGIKSQKHSRCVRNTDVNGRPMNAFLKTQKEQNLTWRDEVAAALSAIELHVQPAIIRQQPEGFFLEKDQVKKPGKALKI